MELMKGNEKINTLSAAVNFVFAMPNFSAIADWIRSAKASLHSLESFSITGKYLRIHIHSYDRWRWKLLLRIQIVISVGFARGASLATHCCSRECENTSWREKEDWKKGEKKKEKNEQAERRNKLPRGGGVKICPKVHVTTTSESLTSVKE